MLAHQDLQIQHNNDGSIIVADEIGNACGFCSYDPQNGMWNVVDIHTRFPVGSFHNKDKAELALYKRFSAVSIH